MKKISILIIVLMVVCVGLSGCFHKELTSIDEGKDSYNLSIVSSTVNWREYVPHFPGDAMEGFTIDNFSFTVRNDGSSTIYFGRMQVPNMHLARIANIRLTIRDTDHNFSYDNIYHLYPISHIGRLSPNDEETVTVYSNIYPIAMVPSAGEYDYSISLYIYNGSYVVYKAGIYHEIATYYKATYSGTTMVGHDAGIDCYRDENE